MYTSLGFHRKKGRKDCIKYSDSYRLDMIAQSQPFSFLKFIL